MIQLRTKVKKKKKILKNEKMSVPGNASSFVFIGGTSLSSLWETETHRPQSRVEDRAYQELGTAFGCQLLVLLLRPWLLQSWWRLRSPFYWRSNILSGGSIKDTFWMIPWAIGPGESVIGQTGCLPSLSLYSSWGRETPDTYLKKWWL